MDESREPIAIVGVTAYVSINPEPHTFTAVFHRAHMTGAPWWKVVDENGEQHGPYFDDKDSAEYHVDELTDAANEPRVTANVESYPYTDDPDSLADTVLESLALESNGVRGVTWRLTGGDDHGEGLTSFDYIGEVYDADTLRAFVEYANGDADDPGRGATPNMGLLTGPEEYGLIPGGVTYLIDGMSYNVGGVTRVAGVDASVWPITVDAARYLGMIDDSESEGVEA